MAILLSILTYGAAILGVLLVALYVYCSRKYDHWRNKGVKQVKPFPFVGSMKDMVLMRKSMGDIFKEIYDQHKDEPFIGFYALDEPILLVNDLEIVKSVLMKDFQYFTDRNFFANEKTDPLGSRGLFALKGDRWRHTRSVLTPCFTSGKMKRMFGIIADYGEALSHAIQNETEKPITAYEVVARYTTDVIASCAFGIQSNTLQNPDSELRAKLAMVLKLSPIEALKFLATFLAPKLVETFNIKIVNSEVENYVLNMIKSTIQHREEHDIKRNDLLNSLMEIMNQETDGSAPEEKTENMKYKIKMDFIDVAAQSFTFLVAGFETSATTITYALYELAKNMDIQERLRAEILEVLHANNEQISYDSLHCMKYLDMVIQETLRKFPPVPFTDRISNKPYIVPGTQITLEAKTVVMIPTLAIHRDPRFYPEPLKFDPERFTEENKASRHPCAHIPFSEGPRICIGLRFAMLQMKIGLVNILKHYSVHTCSTTPKEIEFTTRSFLAQPKKHVELIFRRLADQ